MITITNECCGCAVPAYPCLGSGCPNRHVKHFICDECEEEVDELYKVDGLQLCEECLLDRFERVEDE